MCGDHAATAGMTTTENIIQQLLAHPPISFPNPQEGTVPKVHRDCLRADTMIEGIIIEMRSFIVYSHSFKSAVL